MSDQSLSARVTRANQRMIQQVAISYAIVASLWIVISDQLLALSVNEAALPRVAIYKGLAFVMVTAALLYFLLRAVTAHTAQGSMQEHAATWPPPDTALLTRRSGAGAYAIALLAIAVTFALRGSWDVSLEERPTFNLFMIPITLSALLSGLGPGLFVTALAVVGVSGLLPLPIEALRVDSTAEAVLIGMMAINGVAISVVCEALHMARRRAEALMTSQQRVLEEYRLLSDQLPDCVWRKDLEGRYVSCNARFAAAIGRAPHEVIGHKETELFPSDDALRWRAEDLRVIESRTPLEREELWCTAQQVIGWVLVSKAPVLDNTGACIGTIGVARDISGRHAAEEALRDSESHLRALFELGEDAILMFVLKPDGTPGRFIDFNPAAVALLGWSRDELLDLEPARLLHAMNRALAREIGQRLQQAGRLRIDLTIIGKRGNELPVDATITLVRQRDDGTQAALAVLRDMSDRRQADAEQARLQAQVIEMQKNQAIGQLAGGIAHDFNNILATVLGYCELAMTRAAVMPGSRLHDYLDAIHSAGERGRDLVSKMMTFSRSAPQVPAQRPDPVFVEPIVEEALRLLRATIPSSTRINFERGTQLSAVYAERVEIEQMIMNLVINARDAIDGIGGITVEIHPPREVSGICRACRQDIDGHYLAIAVSDTGQPFYTTKEVGRGTGLGLSVVHGIAHKLGGHILLRSTLDMGSTFDILLPAASALPPTADAAELLADAEAEVHNDGRGRHVMVVDDEPLLALYWREVLETAGYRVSEFHDGALALEAFLAAPDTFDAVLTDQTMPGIPGDVLARRIRELRPALPVILCSGYSERLALPDFAALGLSAVFRKPVNAELILSTLRDAAAP